MSARRGIGIALLVILVVALLAVYGFSVYRFGYVRGAQAAGPTTMWEGPLPRMGRGVMTHVWMGDGALGFPWMQSLPGLFSGLGMLGIVGLAIVGLVHLLRPAVSSAQNPPASGAGEGQSPS